jgi:hypothetical protein
VIGLAAGLLLAIAAMAWVLAPIVRQPASGASPAPGSHDPTTLCRWCSTLCEADARFCSACGRAVSPM